MHLSRPLMIIAAYLGSERPSDGQRSKDRDAVRPGYKLC
jgi:hypothetical protein